MSLIKYLRGFYFENPTCIRPVSGELHIWTWLLLSDRGALASGPWGRNIWKCSLWMVGGLPRRWKVYRARGAEPEEDRVTWYTTNERGGSSDRKSSCRNTHYILILTLIDIYHQVNNIIIILMICCVTWKLSVDARLGSAHTAEICAAIGRPVSASMTWASGESMTTLTTDDRICSVGL